MSIELLQQRTLKWEIDRLNDLALDPFAEGGSSISAIANAESLFEWNSSGCRDRVPRTEASKEYTRLC